MRLCVKIVAEYKEDVLLEAVTTQVHRIEYSSLLNISISMKLEQKREK